MPILKTINTKKCENFCENEYVDKFIKSKKNKMKKVTKNQIDKGKKMISLICKMNYCNKGCIGMTKKYPNNICNTKKCKKTYNKIKKYPIDTFCSEDEIWEKL
jgi:hypothetical protein